MKFKNLPYEDICPEEKNCEFQNTSCEKYHPDEFCLICDERLGDIKVYIEVHGKHGWAPKSDIPQADRNFICWPCVCAIGLNKYLKKKGE